MKIANLAVVAIASFLAFTAQALTCDVNGDGAIDRTDINLIIAARNASASGLADARDPDGDGKVTVVDARICTLRCTRPNCSTANSAPVAHAGPAQTAHVTDTVTLNGSTSSDPDGDPLTFAWTFVSRPIGSTVSLSGADTVAPSFVVDRPGSYVIQLIVNDGSVGSAPDTVTVSTLNSPPTANAGPNQTIQVANTVQLNGAGSTDVDGDPLTFAWTLSSRPAGSVAALANPSAVNPTFIADRAGSYVAQLIVHDGHVASLPASVSITTVNSPPVADAGPDQSVLVGEMVSLNGGASSDVDGNALTFIWSLTTRPAGSNATLSNPNLVNPTFVADEAGTYVAQLVINDGAALSEPDTVVVSTRNSAPVANPGPNRTVALGSLVQLNGSGSTDVDGDPLTFRWALTTKPIGSTAALSNATEVNPTFVADRSGTYVAQLIVNDGQLDSLPVTVMIATQNSVPMADAGPDQTASLGGSVTLSGGASSDADGNPLTYRWSLLSRPVNSLAILSSPTSVSPTFVVDKPGTYVAQLIVNDGFVDSAPDTVSITTQNSIPVANAGPDQNVTAGAIVTLNGSASADADGDPLSYFWSLTARPAGSAATLAAADTAVPTFLADRSGIYVAQLIVNDGSVDSAPDTMMVTAAAPNAAPVAANDSYRVDQNGTLTVPAPGVLANDSDAEGSPLTAVLATNVGLGVLTLNADGSFTYTPNVNVAGADSFTYRASDGALLSNVTTVTLTIAAVNHPPVANAGTDQDVNVGATVTLNGAGSSDPDGNPITFNWTFVSRPAGSAAVLTAPTSASPVFTPDQPGNYVVQLIVRDGSLASAPDTVVVNATAGGGQQTSGPIGPAGGTLTLPDGLRLTVPAGALATATTITITEAPLSPGTVMPPTGVLAGKVYTFEPDGLAFAVPAALTIPYDPTLLPAGYSEGDILIHRRSTAPQFHAVGNANDTNLESPGQQQDLVAKTLTVNILGFSQYGAVGNNQANTWVSSTLTSPTGTASIVVRRPPTGMRTQKSVNQGNCNAGAVPLPARPAPGVQGVVIHSTNGTNPAAGINGALGWSSNDCVRDFTHYMIDKDGIVYQIADDALVTNHVGGVFSSAVTPRTDLVNDNTVGIEVLNNVGEPYDGQQIASLIRLVDYLLERHALPRPARDPVTGLYAQNRTNINTGGERVITHFDFNGKCDPIGSMRSSGVYYPVNNAQGCAAPAVPIAQGDASAPSLLDAIYDAWAMLQRNRQHTGIIQASGGDALGLATPGNGGNVTLREDAAVVAAVLGVVRPRLSTENTPLIVGPGTTRTLAGQHTFTDAIIAGRLEITGDLDLRLIGTLYLAPNGRIVLRRGNDGGNLTITTRGIPIIQGLIDAIGNDGPSANSAGGNGGSVTVVSAGSAPWLIPTIIARGGDADFASAGIGVGGTGGKVTISVQSGSLILGGGVGVQTVANDISSARPPVRDQVDRPNLPAPPGYVGDRLPPPPPFSKYTSIAVGTRMAGVKEPLRTAGFQQGFARGILTTGGIGGAGLATAADNVDGGAGGAGGNIDLTVSEQGHIRFKDVDLITGADVETAVKSLILPEGGTNTYTYFPASGSLGGTGRTQTSNRSGGSGGAGAQAGNITVAGALVPAPVTFAPVGPLGSGEIIGIDRPPNSVRPHITDDFIFDFIMGRRIEAADAEGNRLYRLRLGLTTDGLLGGSGGVPAGGIAGEFPGWFGTKGANGTLTGLPVR